MIEPIIESALKEIDAIIVIDPEDGLGNCWSKQGTNYYVFKELSDIANQKGIKIFSNKSRGLIIRDSDYINMLDLTKEWSNIKEFKYEKIAEKIDSSVKKPRDEITLGFLGTFSISCVRRHLYAMCDEKIESLDFKKRWVNMGNDSISKKFKKGILLYELTEDVDKSIFTNNTIRNYLIRKHHIPIYDQ